MTFIQLELPGVCMIEPLVHADERGAFRRHFCAEEFAAHGLDPAVAQGNISENRTRGTLRGLHYQAGRCSEAKTMSCLSGAVHAIVVDLRRDSPTYLRWTGVTFSAEDRRSLHVPRGCASGWITTLPHTIIHYYMSSAHDPSSARGIRYDDPAFGFRWPLAPVVISARDRAYSDFDPASLKPF